MRHLDLFSGIGGMSLGLEAAGMETVGFVEYDAYCQQILKQHWPEVPLYGDIHDVKGDEFGTVDLISGGFPCQGFSFAGQRRGKEDDRYLWPEMFRLIKAIRPAWVIGENVPGIISLALDTVLSDLESEGYATRTFVLPAVSVDAPYRRDRVWIVAYSERNRLQRRADKAAGRQKQSGKQQLAGLLLTGAEASVSSARTYGDRYGVSPQVDRNKALGNAVVPPLVEQIGRVIIAASTGGEEG